ncbi:HK97 family phage prohead protease [Salinicoccus halitifaciens]|uniref:HK97 family phage prohead protease n=1 Tax=Salinicoccus halitifaciens TaxID=1073415 RepID=A0ABV2E5S7_9STAP|nr:HK97 family phage prohead protease [Salinicoccus halitifaciens]MCD2137176.1 HK97 family phage prohead protease [Salinicoccus halitifaciens]
MSNVEKRFIDVEVRAESNEQEKMVIEGYALKFNTKSNPLRSNDISFVETISPEALKDADMEDVRALIDHNPSLVLARTTADTLKLEVDEVGLKFRAELADTTYARDLYKNIEAGNINQCSFAFELDEKGDSVRYNKETRMYERTLNSFKKIIDVSAVTYPAYSDTDVAPALRSIEEADKEAEQLKEQQKRKLQLELELMQMKGEQ